MESNTETNVTNWMLPIITIGIVGNLYISYIVFRKKHFQWESRVLIQNVAVSDLLHLILAGTYKMVAQDNDQFFKRTPMCALVYPIFTVTACNPNLTIILIFAFQSYKSSLTSVHRLSKNTVKGLLVAGWIGCYFLFTPQVFVEDLTQVNQDCEGDSMGLIIEMRISYWIGTLYIQAMICGISLLYLVLMKRQLVKLELNGVVSSSGILRGSGRYNSQKINGEASQTRDSEKRPLRKESEVTRVVTFSDTSASSSSSNSSDNKPLAFSIRNQRSFLILLIAFIVTHIISLIPQNIFFFWYYFGRNINPHFAMKTFQASTTFTFVNSLLNPVLFIALQEEVRRDCIGNLRSGYVRMKERFNNSRRLPLFQDTEVNHIVSNISIQVTEVNHIVDDSNMQTSSV